MPDAGGTGDGYSVGEFQNKVAIGEGSTSLFDSPNQFNPLNVDRTAYALIPVTFRAAPDGPTTRSPQFTVDFDWEGDWSDVFAASSDLEFRAINPALGWTGLDDTQVGTGYDPAPLHYASLSSLPGGGGYAANQGSPGGLGAGGSFHMTRAIDFWATKEADNEIPEDYIYPGGQGGNGPWITFNILLFLMFGRVLQGGSAPSATFQVYQTWDGVPLPEFEPCPPHIEWPYLPEALGIDDPDTGVIRVGTR